MKNIFIITLGTREVQFRESELIAHGFILPQNDKGVLYHPGFPDISIQVARNDNYPEFICCQAPRTGGKSILDHWDLFENIVEFPLIRTAFDNLIKKYTIHEVVLVYTDQCDLDANVKQNLRNHDRDTVNFRFILRKHFKARFPELPYDPNSDIPIHNKATDIDIQYRYFSDKCKSLFEKEKEIQNIFLLAQGGIDQINHALTLQLIQAFGSKVRLWQQAEGDIPKELFFPSLFLNDLEKAQIKELLVNFDFKGISIVSKDAQIKYLAGIGDSLMTFRSAAIEASLINHPTPGNQYYPDVIKAVKSYSSGDSLLTLQLLYLGAKIYYRKSQANEVIWRLHTLGEMLLKPIAEDILGGKIPMEEIPFNQFNQLLKQKAPSDLINRITKITSRQPFITPSKATFSIIYNYYYTQLKIGKKDPVLEAIRIHLGKLDKTRNELLHNALGWDFSLFQAYLKSNNISWIQLEGNLDSYYHVDPGTLGIFDLIISSITKRMTN